MLAFAIVGTSILVAQSATAIIGPGTPAKDFAPGNLKADNDVGNAKNFAPGQEAKIIGPEVKASDLAPGHVKVVEPK